MVQSETFAPILYVMTFETLDEAIALQNGVPVLGVCLGQQCMGHVFGGSVGRAPLPSTSAISPIGIEVKIVMRWRARVAAVERLSQDAAASAETCLVCGPKKSWIVGFTASMPVNEM